MSTKGKVSVIIPSYNYGHYLEECVDSVLQQSYDNWEAIIVDDGSQDDTPQVGAKLANENPSKVKFYRTKNQGVSKARNFAIEQSDGEFILPLDADDMLSREALEHFVATINQDARCGFACSSVEMFGGLPGEPTEWIPGTNVDQIFPIQNVAPISSIWRKSLWYAGVEYKERFFEDWDLWLQILAKGYHCAYTPEKLFRYRLNPDGRDSHNKYFYYQALAQQARGNPQVYPAQMVAWADTVLALAPQCFNLPTIVFIPSAESSELTNFSGNLYRIAKSFVERGYLTAPIGQYDSKRELHAGIMNLNCPTQADFEWFTAFMKQLGAQLIVFTERESYLSAGFRKLDNVHSIISINDAFDCGADLNLIQNEKGFLVQTSDSESASNAISKEQMIDYVLERFSQNLEKNTGQAKSFRKKLSALSKIDFTQSDSSESVQNENNSLSVVIPTRNIGLKRLERCLQSIRESESAQQLEIVVSDYGSTQNNLEGLRQLTDKYQVKLIESKVRSNWSRSKALNIAIRQCQSCWILFTDADMIFHPSLIPMWRQYHSMLGDNIMYLGQCRKLPPLGDLPLPWHSSLYNQVANQGRVFATYGQGGCQIIRTAWLKKVRGFNEVYQVWGSEDNDLTFRAELDGIKPVWMQAGKLLHQWHIKSVASDWRNKNNQNYRDMVKQGELIVNDESWGIVSSEEQQEYEQMGPLAEKVGDNEKVSKLYEEKLCSVETSLSQKVELLTEWGNHAVSNYHDETALETFEDALTLDASNTEILLGLSKTYILRSAPDKAGHFAKLVLSHDPHHPVAKQILETAYSMQINPEGV